jgi:hypothetical protein
MKKTEMNMSKFKATLMIFFDILILKKNKKKNVELNFSRHSVNQYY